MTSENTFPITWHIKAFHDLTTQELYDILAARQEVFIVEQKIVALDSDYVDQLSWHVFGYSKVDEQERIMAYARIVEPGIKYSEVAIGRVLTMQSARGTGVGIMVMNQAIDFIRTQFPNCNIRVSSQTYIKGLYKKLGFKIASEPYMEEGVLHVEMLKEMSE